jgi:hypothetical protein
MIHKNRMTTSASSGMITRIGYGLEQQVYRPTGNQTSNATLDVEDGSPASN